MLVFIYYQDIDIRRIQVEMGVMSPGLCYIQILTHIKKKPFINNPMSPKTYKTKDASEWPQN